MPLLVVSYMLQYMDKVSLSNAMVMGITTDLGLHGTESSWLSSMFYLGYLAASYPVSILLVRFPLGRTLAVAIVLWGIVLACHAAASTFTGMMVTRTLLGVLESPISPGFTLITSMWYQPSEHAARHGLWYAGNSMGASVGSLIAFGCAHLQNGTLSRWQVLFLILGCMTVVWGAALLMLLPDSPLTAKFLRAEERLALEGRVQARQKTSKTNKWSRQQFWEALTDPKSWFLFWIEGTGCLTNGVLSNFSSLILASFGFTTLTTLLLNLPIYFFQFSVVLGSVWLAHRTPRSRIILTVVGNLVALIGAVVLLKLPSSNKGGRYVSLLLMNASINGFPLYLSLISSNVGGFTKRATVNAIFFVGYCAGNVAGPQLYIPAEAPKYTTAFTSMMVIFAVDAVLLLLFRVYLDQANKKRDREQGIYINPEPKDGEVINAAPSSGRGHDDLEIEEPADQTDWENRSFRYYL
ncbi:hypothetical protein ASPZODRAFT_156286 [Penicilliopsis zonata CBS 506.65]|uniref:Major facilitator superfamily (MFS) profile domain-containing protein n=1 Tax=Penicilliopsis zonata CBS 506.65 TaxID=1073090 RepID=A0A1L9SW74_9EURO|nr:hypothetical protein ASPZODRAFT_156286 [Penicilliopsis zonata CBS 506.65]OJJ51394.1 hypothetical protein ASPZODRAFT_156286 [Penicilliopsis zonata CBS 506.65]